MKLKQQIQNELRNHFLKRKYLNKFLLSTFVKQIRAKNFSEFNFEENSNNFVLDLIKPVFPYSFKFSRICKDLNNKSDVKDVTKYIELIKELNSLDYIQINWKTIQHKILGKQNIPDEICIKDFNALINFGILSKQETENLINQIDTLSMLHQIFFDNGKSLLSKNLNKIEDENENKSENNNIEDDKNLSLSSIKEIVSNKHKNKNNLIFNYEELPYIQNLINKNENYLFHLIKLFLNKFSNLSFFNLNLEANKSKTINYKIENENASLYVYKLLSIVEWKLDRIINKKDVPVYIREIKINHIDTKFIENNQSILSELFDLFLPADYLVSTSKEKKDGEENNFDWNSDLDLNLNSEKTTKNKTLTFEEKYRFKTKEKLIRFKYISYQNGDVEETKLNNGSILELIKNKSSMTLNIEMFNQLINLESNDIDFVIVVENEINFLTLKIPEITKNKLEKINVLVIFGAGYSVGNLTELREKETILSSIPLYYWGDLDTHGFAILNRMKKYFPQTQSFLMDEKTLLSHKNNWTNESKQHGNSISDNQLIYLNQEENLLYQNLKNQIYGENIRLEQELINYVLVENKLEEICLKIIDNKSKNIF